MARKVIIPGIHIQYPISQEILSGKKTLETRTYTIPKKYIGKDLAFIETPGREGKFVARIVAIIRFGEPFKYKNAEQFQGDYKKHRVDSNSPWIWTEKGKWGWPITHIRAVKPHIEAPKKRGIKFTLECLMKF